MSARRPAGFEAIDPDERDTLADLAAILSVQSLDLRAEYEAKLRILTEIQREIEALRAPVTTKTQRRAALDQLQRRFLDLTRANRDASETLKMIRDEFDRVRRQEGRPRKASAR
jgi:predicted RNase H-like nuclease (RuvC/YqgF family)